MNIITLIYFALIFIQCISIICGDTDYIPVPCEEFEAVKNAMDFTGKVVLITGSSSGIGATTALNFCYLGAKVVITGRNKTRINEIVNECRKLSPHNIKPLGIQFDLTIRGNVAKLVNTTATTFGKIDILINCAGIAVFATIQDPNFNEVYARIKAINEEMPVELVRLAVPYLEETNGSIVLIASLLARNPVSTSTAYSMAKNALVALTASIAFDVGPNVRINIISPGVVDGTRIFRYLPGNVRTTLIENTIASAPLQRPGVPMDIAKIIIFLCSYLCTYFDGSNIFADGGITIKLL